MKNKALSITPIYLFGFLLLTIIGIGILISLNYIDYTNMLNNGYVHEEAEVNNVKMSENNPLKVGQGNYLLYQTSSASALQYVFLSGDIKLPPIKWTEPYDLFSFDRNIAVIGERIDEKDVPERFEVVGTFQSEDSFKLKSAIWLIPKEQFIRAQYGERLILNSPDDLSMEQVVLNEREVKFVQVNSTPKTGSYTFKSNELTIVMLKISFVFVILFMMLVSSHWCLRNRRFIQIAYRAGESPSSINYFLFKNKWHLLIIIGFVIFVLVSVAEWGGLAFWSNDWVTYARYLVLGQVGYIVCFSMLITSYYTVGKGGKLE